jgi:hypothetical protein
MPNLQGVEKHGFSRDFALRHHAEGRASGSGMEKRQHIP